MKSSFSVKISVIFRRIIEMLIPTMLFSVIISALNILELIVQRYQVILLILFFTVIFRFYNINRLKNSYVFLHNKILYYTLNIIACIIFAAINMVCSHFMPNELYAWTFSITKLLTYIDINTIYSVLLFHIVVIDSVFSAARGMEWVLEEDEESEVTLDELMNETL